MDWRDLPGHVLVAVYLWDAIRYGADGDWLGVAWTLMACMCLLWFVEFGREVRAGVGERVVAS